MVKRQGKDHLAAPCTYPIRKKCEHSYFFKAIQHFSVFWKPVWSLPPSMLPAMPDGLRVQCSAPPGSTATAQECGASCAELVLSSALQTHETANMRKLLLLHNQCMFNILFMTTKTMETSIFYNKLKTTRKSCDMPCLIALALQYQYSTISDSESGGRTVSGNKVGWARSNNNNESFFR